MLDASIQEFLTVLAVTLASALAVRVGFLLNQLAVAAVGWLRSKFTEAQMSALDEFVRIAIQAAEQLGTKAYIENTAAAKLEEATGIVQSFLDSRGLTHFSADQIRAAIEAGLRQGWHNQ